LQCIHHIILAKSQGVVPRPLHAELSDFSCTGCHGSPSHKNFPHPTMHAGRHHCTPDASFALWIERSITRPLH